MWLYVIGPIGKRKERNIGAFEEAQKRLEEAGYRVWIPQEIVPPDATRGDAMRKSVAWMLANDGVALLDGWAQSPGASVELSVAKACGIPTLTVVAWVRRAEAARGPAVLDADGAPINVGDAVYFVGGSGARYAVKDIGFEPDGAFVDIIDEEGRYSAMVNPESLTHERLDSWRAWGEDLDMAVKVGEVDKVEMMRRAKALAKGGQR